MASSSATAGARANGGDASLSEGSVLTAASAGARSDKSAACTPRGEGPCENGDADVAHAMRELAVQDDAQASEAAAAQ
jgi:hypothetical protein